MKNQNLKEISKSVTQRKFDKKKEEKQNEPFEQEMKSIARSATKSKWLLTLASLGILGIIRGVSKRTFAGQKEVFIIVVFVIFYFLVMGFVLRRKANRRLKELKKEMRQAKYKKP